mmetsp:Transcript_79746/g.207221  ORF Transcript_79746/g.207221 Transcript_79746/m.207221 type:complete len:238 (+) Transcript_79746:2925-3638(+)
MVGMHGRRPAAVLLPGGRSTLWSRTMGRRASRRPLCTTSCGRCCRIGGTCSAWNADTWGCRQAWPRPPPHASRPPSHCPAAPSVSQCCPTGSLPTPRCSRRRHPLLLRSSLLEVVVVRREADGEVSASTCAGGSVSCPPGRPCRLCSPTNCAACPRSPTGTAPCRRTSRCSRRSSSSARGARAAPRASQSIAIARVRQLRQNCVLQQLRQWCPPRGCSSSCGWAIPARTPGAFGPRP